MMYNNYYKKRIISFKDIITVAVIFVFLFQQPLQEKVSVFQYFDDLLTALSLGYFLLKRNRNMIYLKMVALMLVILLYGLMCNHLSGVDRTSSAIFMDIIYIFKIFIMYIGASEYYKNYQDIKGILRFTAKSIRIIVIIAFVLLLVSQFMNTGMVGKARYGFGSYAFIYKTAAYFSLYCVGYITILTIDLHEGMHKKYNLLCILLNLILWVSTMRSRAFAYVAIYIVLYVILIKGEKHLTIKKFKKRYFVFISIVAIAIAKNQIENYFYSTVTARVILLQTGVIVMKRFFPLGAGFATYGTEAAKKFYSPLYYEHGVNSFWALTEDGSELTDCYWPALFGELGFIGTMLMVILFYMLFKDIIMRARSNRYLYFAIIFFSMTMFASSTVTAVFASSITVGYMFILGMLLPCLESNFESTK